MKEDNSCAFALCGNGAANQGQIAEALNMSALWNLPVNFVCENSHRHIGMSTERGSKSPLLSKRVDYVPGILVDGKDVLAMKQATTWAKQFVLENGPLILEVDTFRHEPAHTRRILMCQEQFCKLCERVYVFLVSVFSSS
jgi:pyruvate dehydrogenase E1 component alpha subunit